MIQLIDRPSVEDIAEARRCYRRRRKVRRILLIVLVVLLLLAVLAVVEKFTITRS